MKSAYDNESARCKAYAGQFNIDLFNSAVQLAISTTEAPKQVKEVQRKLNRLPWYMRKDAAAFFESHGIRYFGELLERYGEKLGDDLANTRAVALAMGWCAPLLTENMFVGKQHHDFMKRLVGMTDDLYITVAITCWPGVTRGLRRSSSPCARWRIRRKPMKLCVRSSCPR